MSRQKGASPLLPPPKLPSALHRLPPPADLPRIITTWIAKAEHGCECCRSVVMAASLRAQHAPVSVSSARFPLVQTVLPVGQPVPPSSYRPSTVARWRVFGAAPAKFGARATRQSVLSACGVTSHVHTPRCRVSSATQPATVWHVGRRQRASQRKPGNHPQHRAVGNEARLRLHHALSEIRRQMHWTGVISPQVPVPRLL